MPTPFVCRKCTALLARSASRSRNPSQPRLHSRLHSTAILAERPPNAVVLPVRHDQSPDQASDQAPESRSFQPQQPGEILGQEYTASETRVRWDGEVTKVLPGRRRLSIEQPAELPPPSTPRQFKAKILGALGTYRIFPRDLRQFYGLITPEARHAAVQLERLLMGLGVKNAATRLDEYHAWKKNFAAVMRNIATASATAPNNPGANAIPCKSKTAFRNDETAPMKTAWQRLDKDRRQLLWPTMVLSALESEPHTLPTLIQSTFDPSWCPSYVVEDLLYFLSRRLQQALKKEARSDYDQIQQEFGAIASFVLGNCPPRYLVLEQTVLRLIIAYLPTSELATYYQLLRSIDHPLHANTLLHFASRFAKGHDTKLHALDILDVLTDMPGFDLNTPAAASVCTSLLSLKENEPLPDQHSAPDVLFEFLLRHGLRPNILELTALMRNFCVRGHLDTAWKICELMFQHGLEPDRHVYSTLLNASKQNHDIDSLEKTFNIITSRNAWSTILLNDFLDFLLRENEWQVEQRRRQRKKGNNAWRPMLQLYAKFFDLAPLQIFTLFPLENMLGAWGVQPKHRTSGIMLAESLMPRPASTLMQPDSTTLLLMLSAHMRSILTPKFAIRYYNHFFKLVHRKVPAALSLLAEHRTLVVDIFLRTLMQFRSTTGFAIRRLQKMINDARKEEKQHGHHLHHHPPSIHTWNIMLNGLKNHNDMRGIVALLDMMRHAGQIKPNLVTWNIVVQGFARTRNVNGAVKAIRSLERAGFQPNDRTIKALRMFPRPLMEQVIARLEQMRQASQDPQGTQALLRNSANKSVASTTQKMQSFSSNEPIGRMKPVVARPKRTPGFSSNEPIGKIRPVIPRTLDELAQQRDRLNPEVYIPRRVRRYQAKLSRSRDPPPELNSTSPYFRGRSDIPVI